MSPILLLTLLFTSASPAPDSPESMLQAAIEDFEFGDRAEATAKLRAIVEPPKLSNKDDLIVARQYLGACYHLLGDKENAKAQFSMLLMLDPRHRLDPAVFSPAVVVLFEQLRAEIGLSPRTDGRGTTPGDALATQPTPGTRASDDVSTGVASHAREATANLELAPATVARPSPLLLIVPFGVGQFANREPLKGALFAAGEVSLFATSAVALATFEGLRRPDGTFEEADGPRARSLGTLYVAAFWSGVALAALGGLEALITHAEAGPTTSPRARGLDGGGSPAGLSFAF